MIQNRSTTSTVSRQGEDVPAGDVSGGGTPAERSEPFTARVGEVTRTSDLGDGPHTVEAAGRFRIYLGVAAGVGKTVAMLDEGVRRRQRGTDVVVGLVETHDRTFTKNRLDDLDVVARQRVEYNGIVIEEMDLDAVLRRRPQVVLVDELAHTNVPGSGPNTKRWQDVLTLLDAGIDVISTVNIQHLESIAEVVEHISHIPVRERVPDWVVRRADQIELVDSSPEQLRRRLLHGNIYPPEEIPWALTHFFRVDNLTALRELALRFLADESEDELLEQLLGYERGVVWETTERIMVGVTSAEGTEAVIRRAARMATRTKARLDAVHVARDSPAARSPTSELDRLRQLATDVGAIWHDINADDPVEALVGFARRNQITQIVIGSSQRSRLQELMGGGSIVRRLARSATASHVDVHIIARRVDREGSGWRPSTAQDPNDVQGDNR